MKSLLKFKSPFINFHLAPPHLAGVCCFIILLLSSCTSFRIPTKSSRAELVKGVSYQEMGAEDFADHFASLKKIFLSTPGVRAVTLDPAMAKYFAALTSEVISKNEIFFKNLKAAHITIIAHEAPLHFSLPKGELFLSSGLIAKYIKHESMLVSILSYELVRSEKLLYPKESIIPTGYLPLERMLMLGRLSLEEKMEVHKWAYHITERSGYDGEYYLSWLQVQNRNTADFILQVGDANLITREESLFKAFLIKNSLENNAIKKNSSREFYALLNKVRDKVL